MKNNRFFSCSNAKKSLKYIHNLGGGTIRKFFHNLRFHTTLKLHHKATGFGVYKKWSDFRFSHHIHVATLVSVFMMMIVSALFQAFAPIEVLAANGSFSQTTFALLIEPKETFPF